MVTKNKETSTKKTVKKSKSNKVTKKSKTTTVKKPSKEDIQRELNAIADAKLAAAGVKSDVKFEDVKVEEAVDLGTEIDKAILDFLKEPSNLEDYNEFQPIMNVLTRMYETSEEEYQNVKFIKERKTIVVDLDKKIYKDLDKEINRIKTQLGYDTLKFNGVEDISTNRIMIMIRMK